MYVVCCSGSCLWNRALCVVLRNLNRAPKSPVSCGFCLSIRPARRLETEIRQGSRLGTERWISVRTRLGTPTWPERQQDQGNGVPRRRCLFGCSFNRVVTLVFRLARPCAFFSGDVVTAVAGMTARVDDGSRAFGTPWSGFMYLTGVWSLYPRGRCTCQPSSGEAAL